MKVDIQMLKKVIAILKKCIKESTILEENAYVSFKKENKNLIIINHNSLEKRYIKSIIPNVKGIKEFSIKLKKLDEIVSLFNNETIDIKVLKETITFSDSSKKITTKNRDFIPFNEIEMKSMQPFDEVHLIKDSLCFISTDKLRGKMISILFEDSKIITTNGTCIYKGDLGIDVGRKSIIGSKIKSININFDKVLFAENCISFLYENSNTLISFEWENEVKFVDYKKLALNEKEAETLEIPTDEILNTVKEIKGSINLKIDTEKTTLSNNNEFFSLAQEIDFKNESKLDININASILHQILNTNVTKVTFDKGKLIRFSNKKITLLTMNS